MTAEVDRCGGVVDLVRQDGQLVVKALYDSTTISVDNTIEL